MFNIFISGDMKYLIQIFVLAISLSLLACSSNSGNSEKDTQDSVKQNQVKKNKNSLTVKKKLKGINVEIQGDLAWSDAFVINNAELDARRRKLLTNYNNLYFIVNSKHNTESVQQAINDLMKVSKETFQAEEERMERFKYDKYQQHKNEHEEFLSKLAKLKENISAKSESEDITNEDVAPLYQFLSNHLSKTDIEMGKFLIEAGSY